MAEARQQSSWARAQDWGPARPAIEKLYLEERRTLKEVMATMERDHQFRATTKMYKRKLKEWGVTKNLKAGEAVALLRTMEARQAAGGSPRVVFRGETHDLDWVREHIRRNRTRGRYAAVALQVEGGMRSSDDTGSDASSSVIVIGTPPRGPAPALESRGPQGTAEELLRSLSVYVDGSLASGRWYSGGGGRMRSARGDPARYAPLLKDLWNRLDMAAELMSKPPPGKAVDLVRLLDPALARMDDLIRDEYPRILPFMLSAFQDMYMRGRYELIGLFLRHISSLAGRILGPNHPQSRVWAQALESMYTGDHDDALERLFFLFLDRMRAQPRRAVQFEIGVYNDYCDAVLIRKDLETQERSLREQVNMVRPMDETSLQACLLRLRHATAFKDLCLRQGRYEEAETAMDVLRDYGDWDGAHGIRARAEVRVKVGDWEGAERYYREASTLIDSNPRFTDEVWANDVLENLETALAQNGKPEEAGQVRQSRLERIERLASQEDAP